MTRVLLITRNLPPLVGGMERLNWHMAEALSRFAEVHVIGPAGAAALAPAGVKIFEVPLKPLPRFLLRAQWLAWHEAKHWRPDIILAGSGVTAPLARLAAYACKAASAVYVHGLDVAVRNPVYRAIWIGAIRHMDRVIANSHATRQIAISAGVEATRVGIVHPGVELPSGTSASQSVADFRAQHGLGERPLLLSVGRLTRRKGLREFVRHALPHIVAAQPEVMLLIVGEIPNHSLHAEAQSPAAIQRDADAAGVGAHLKFLGVVIDRKQLATIYQSCDAHVFPVRSIPDDPEGFGMVAVEAAANGLPTVAFATGGVVDAVAEDRSGHLVTPGDYAAFADSVLRILAERGALHASSIEFARQFAWPEFGVQIVVQLAHVVPQLR